jgi:hypothetical protein
VPFVLGQVEQLHEYYQALPEGATQPRPRRCRHGRRRGVAGRADALGCTGGAPGDLLKSAKNKGLLKGNDTPLTDAVCKTVDWVAAKRNQGEAHKGDPDINKSDAWMVVRSAV